jgi:hypothetical protein
MRVIDSDQRLAEKLSQPAATRLPALRKGQQFFTIRRP